MRKTEMGIRKQLAADLAAVKNARMEKFLVEIEPEDCHVNVRVTHNGYAWTVLRLYEDEISRVIAALQKYQNERRQK